MLYEWIREYIKKYSFITDTEFKGATLFIYYIKDGKKKFKKLPYRATKHQLQACIERIKKEIDYYEDRKERIKNGQYDIKDDSKPFFDVL